MSLNMFPQLAECDFSGSSFVDTKDSANFAKRHAESIHVSDLVHLGFVEQNSWVSFSKKCSAFLLAIISVVLGRSKEKMVWIYARRIIAAVAYQIRTWIDPVLDKISDSIGTEWAAVIVKYPIVFVVTGAFPQPAFANISSDKRRHKASAMRGANLGNWFRMVIGHLISWIDRLSRPRCGWYHFEAALILTGKPNER